MNKAIALEAEESPWVSGWKDEQKKDTVFKLIIGARLSPDIWFNYEIKDILEQSTEPKARKALALYFEIQGVKEKLVMACIKNLNDVASEAIRGLQGDVITKQDILQEALILTDRYAMFYNPHKSNTMFTTYVISMVKSGLKNYIAENTRTIHIPRSQLDRYTKLVPIVQKVKNNDFELIAKIANKQILENNPEAKRRELFTKSEVEKCITAISTTTTPIHHNNDEDDKNTFSLLNVIDSPAHIEELYFIKEQQDQLCQLMKKVLSYDEFNALYLRFGLDGSDERTISECVDSWYEPIGKIKFSKILQNAKSRLRVHKKKFIEFSKEFDDLYARITNESVY